MKLLVVLAALGVAISNVQCRKTCQVVPPTLEELQKSMGGLFLKAGASDYHEASEAHIINLNRLGLNTEKVRPIHHMLEVFRHTILFESRSSESDLRDLDAIVQDYYQARDDYFNSQPGLENFKTDETKLNDPFLKEWYEVYEGSNKSIRNLADDPSRVNSYFSQETANYTVKVPLILSRIVARARANAAANPSNVD